MVDPETRREYGYNRVLIEAERVLDPQFGGAVVFLSGAQIELLRNVTQYLNRLETYVSEYKPGYYLTPNAGDYGSILEIVADLEETLMGNPNTIWGYKEPYGEALFEGALPAGDSSEEGSAVPAGEVWKVKGASFYVDSGSCTAIILLARVDGAYVQLDSQYAPFTGELYTVNCDVTLKEGDFMYTSVHDMTLSDNLGHMYWGYKMAVLE